MEPNSTASLRGSSQAASILNSLSIAGGTDAWSATLDIGNSAMVVRSPDANGALAAITNQLRSGFNESGVLWTGKGIISSMAAYEANEDVGSGLPTAVGVIWNVETDDDGNVIPIYTSWEGVTVDANSILIKYTYLGDTNLDGVVDIATDFQMFKGGLFGGLSGWENGDFNYDGVVDIATDFQMFKGGLFGQGGQLVSAGGVPEPCTLALLALGAALSLSKGGLAVLRRRRLGLLPAQPRTSDNG
jgi:hypothetical protein